MTIAERVTRKLGAAIIGGALPAGTRLDEVVWADRLGVSRTPLREALCQLSTIGLAETRPHRGAVVGDGGAVFVALAELEAACARKAAVGLDVERRRALAARIDEGADWVALLHDACGNSILSGLADTLWAPVLELAGTDSPLALGEPLRHLVASAVADGDGARLAELVSRLVDSWRQAVSP